MIIIYDVLTVYTIHTFSIVSRALKTSLVIEGILKIVLTNDNHFPILGKYI